MRKRLWSIAFSAVLLLSLPEVSGASNKRCLYVSSYQSDSTHSSEILRGLRSSLGTKCEIRKFEMNSEHSRMAGAIDKAADAAVEVIEQWKPDVVVVCDDGAVAHLLAPFYKNSTTPFVFCGANWSVHHYGLPYANATGMVEVAPIEEVLDIAQEYVPSVSRTYYLGADTRSEKKIVEDLKRLASTRGIEVDFALTSDYPRWITAYEQAQKYDVVIVGNNLGVKPWNKLRVIDDMRSRTKRLTITMFEWMMPYASIGTTTVSSEQGDWAGKLVAEILDGASPSDIPVVANRRWDYWVNQEFLDHTGLAIPDHVRNRVKEYAASE